MKTAHLHDIWAGPDNSRLVSKQFSFRLPVHIASKIAALCDMYPQKNRTQIVADLLTSALDDLEKNLPASMGTPISEDDEMGERYAAQASNEDYVPLFYLGGPRGRFRELANEHYNALESELGNETPEPLYSDICMTEAQFKK